MLAFVVIVPLEKPAEKIAQAEEQITQGMDGLAKVTLIVLFPASASPLNSRLRWLSPTIIEAKLTAYWIGAIRLDPQNAQALFPRRMSLDVLGDYQRAKSAFDEAIRLALDDVVAYYNRAIVHTRLDMDREA